MRFPRDPFALHKQIAATTRFEPHATTHGACNVLMSDLVDAAQVTLFGRTLAGTTTVLSSDVATVRSTTTRGRCLSNCSAHR